MKNHKCEISMSIVCIHLTKGDDWWGVPTGGEFYDWMCGRCIDKFRAGKCPGIEEMRSVCTECVREMQAASCVHYPIETGDGSWRYDNDLIDDEEVEERKKLIAKVLQQMVVEGHVEACSDGELLRLTEKNLLDGKEQTDDS
jgi:hypothetical protein